MPISKNLNLRTPKLASFFLRKKINNLVNFIFDLIFPVNCIGCENLDTWLCLECFDSLKARQAKHCPFCQRQTICGETCPNCALQKNLNGAISLIPYSNGLIREIIYTWKYHGIKEITKSLGLFACQELEKNKKNIPFLNLTSNPLLVPIPLHKRRKKQRGFNQSELLARYITKNFDLKFSDILIKKTSTHSQVNLELIDRIINVKKSMRLLNCESIENKNIVLIDDVITSASTCEEAASVFKKAGAKSVWALSIAYGHPQKQTNFL